MAEQVCSTAFLNAYCNYPLLIGQQTNLYKCVLENTMDLVSPTNGYIGLLTPESIYDDPNGQPLRRELYKRLRYHFQYQNELRLFAEVDHHTVYGDQLLGPRRSSSPRFASLSNLSIQVLWMDALRMMDMVCAEVSKMRMVIGTPNLIVIGLLLLLIKNYRYCLTRLKMGLRAIVPSWLVFILRRLSVY